jgi:aminocarboxymuconate-semialdehyde decarboxylase
MSEASQASAASASPATPVEGVVDFHNHYYPPAYLAALSGDAGGAGGAAGRSNVRVTVDGAGNPLLHYPGDYNVAVRGHRDIEYRAEVLAALGVATQVLSLTTPGTHVEEPATAARLASLVNDALAAVVRDHHGRFAALATLPLNDPAAAVRELDRAMGELGLPGAMLFSNVNGTALADRRFWPLYEAADARGAILHIHPTAPVGVEAMTSYWLMPLVGFLFDTTLAAAHLVFAGVALRFPRIRWVLSHLGGALPYIAERLDRGFHAFRECRAHLDRPPSEVLKGFYFDTVNFDPAALELAIRFAGPGHILAGSDYPHQIGSLPSMLESIGGLPIAAADRAAILGGNGRRLLG